MHLTREIIDQVFPNALELVVNCIVTSGKAFDTYGVNTPLRLSHFFAQVGEETGGLRGMTEGGLKALPIDFTQYDHHPGLGNNQEGDGFKYRGRGLIQLTGKGNYTWIGGILGVKEDYLSDPTMVAEDPHLLLSALQYWESQDLNTHADDDDINKITRIINGGYTGLDERIRTLKKMKEALDI